MGDGRESQTTHYMIALYQSLPPSLPPSLCPFLSPSITVLPSPLLDVRHLPSLAPVDGNVHARDASPPPAVGVALDGEGSHSFLLVVPPFLQPALDGGDGALDGHVLQRWTEGGRDRGREREGEGRTVSKNQ